MKKLTKTMALLLAVVLVFALVATGCGDSKTPTNEAPAQNAGNNNAAAPAENESEGYYFGTNTWGSGVPIVDMIGDARQYSIEAFGNKVMRASDDFTADKELQNGQNFVAAGVDAIAFQGGAPNVITQIAALCKEQGIPFTLDTQIGTPDMVDELAANNEFFCGAVDPNCVLSGEQLAERAYADGCRTAIIIGGNIGDCNMDDRSAGFTSVFESLGGKIVAEGRCTDQSECATKMEDMLSANRDVDCVYAMVGDYTAGSLSAMQNLGVSPKFYVSCIDADSARYIQEGVIEAGNDGITLPPMLTPTLLMNYLAGNKIVDENGKAPHLMTVPLVIDKTNVDLYMKVFCTDGVQAMSTDLIKSFVITYNENASYEYYQEVINTQMTLEKLAEGLGIQ